MHTAAVGHVDSSVGTIAAYVDQVLGGLVAQVEPGAAGGKNSAVIDKGVHCEEAVLATGEGSTSLSILRIVLSIHLLVSWVLPGVLNPRPDCIRAWWSWWGWKRLNPGYWNTLSTVLRSSCL